MGQCYDVTALVMPIDEGKTVRKLQKFISSGSANFRLDEHKGDGINGIFPDNLTDLLKITICERDVEINEAGEFETTFKATYGWETEMYEMFEFIADTLKPGSYIEVWPDDSGDWKLTINESGEIVETHEI